MCNALLRMEDTTLRLPELIGEPNEKGYLRTDQYRCETMGLPKRRERAPCRTIQYPWYSQEELEECSWVNSLPGVERQWWTRARC